MKRLLIIMLTICVWTNKVCAQFHSMNYDKETVAAMATAFGAEAVAEGYYSEQVGAILKHYNAAELAAAGIFASKFLERKAMTDLGLWNSSTENYYYKRIYNMVSHKIMPKIWTVSKMMLHSPQTALYWGSYLVKVCDDTKNLCMQFESVVTNSTLTFADIQFLEINKEIAAILKLSDIGNVDWKGMLNDLAKVPGNFTVDNLTADIDNLYNMGVGLATSGMTNIGDALLQKSAFKEVFNGKVSKVIDIYKNYNDLFEQFDKDVGSTLLNMVGGKDNVAGLFNIADYNLTSWITDYMSEANGQYYTQRWYIYRRDRGTETLVEYNPPTDDNSILKGDHWYRISTKDPDFKPDGNQREAILQNSENHAGWSRAKVQQLNNLNDGYNYNISYWLSSYTISKKKKQKQKAFAYHILVTKSWDREDTWSPLTVGTKEQYLYMDNVQGSMQGVTTYGREYITGEKRKQQSNSIYKTINGEECLVTYAYYAINKNRGKEYNSKDAYVCEHFMRNEYAISNNDHHIILEGLKSVKLSDDNIAEVVFVGEDKTTWVNLYTMQEFDERPVVEKMGFMDVLRVGYNYYFYKNRDIAGIPMHHRECVANDRIFQFLDLYMILRDQPNKVYYISGEHRRKEQWYLILIDITNANSKTHKEIPSMWLPRRS